MLSPIAPWPKSEQPRPITVSSLSVEEDEEEEEAEEEKKKTRGCRPTGVCIPHPR